MSAKSPCRVVRAGPRDKRLDPEQPVLAVLAKMTIKSASLEISYDIAYQWLLLERGKARSGCRGKKVTRRQESLKRWFGFKQVFITFMP